VDTSAAGGTYITGSPESVLVADGVTAAGVEIGVRSTVGGVLTGQAFLDANGNQTRDAGESAAVGFTVFADANNNNTLDAGEASATTAADGTYGIALPANGTYSTRLLPGTGFALTTTPPGPVVAAGGNLFPAGNFGVRVVANLPTTANPDSTTIGEDNGATPIFVLANDTHPDTTTISIFSTTLPAQGGNVTVTGSGTGLTYTPPPQFFGTDTFRYTIRDTQGNSSEATVTVTVVRGTTPRGSRGAATSPRPPARRRSFPGGRSTSVPDRRTRPVKP
jgi:hypothetical protein